MYLGISLNIQRLQGNTKNWQSKRLLTSNVQFFPFLGGTMMVQFFGQKSMLGVGMTKFSSNCQPGFASL